ncbi:hypothetical protein GW17_00039392 [Ensete ventricosum]|nr:hypothetical protein GW17_00039392 [Ensete ventricosum]
MVTRDRPRSSSILLLRALKELAGIATGHQKPGEVHQAATVGSQYEVSEATCLTHFLCSVHYAIVSHRSYEGRWRAGFGIATKNEEMAEWKGARSQQLERSMGQLRHDHVESQGVEDVMAEETCRNQLSLPPPLRKSYIGFRPPSFSSPAPPVVAYLLLLVFRFRLLLLLRLPSFPFKGWGVVQYYIVSPPRSFASPTAPPPSRIGTSPMAEPGDQMNGGGAGGTGVVRISSQVMVTAAIFLFMVVVFVFFLYLYARRYFRPDPALRGRSRTRFVFAAADMDPAPRRGLDAAVLCSLPVTVYRAADFEEGLECAVCLCELADGEEARLLPKCGHGFHLQCIDMWFHSHSTCPLCRDPVGAEPSGSPDAGAEATEAPPPETVSEALVFPPNLLFCGDQDQANAENSSTAAVAERDGSPPEGPSTSSGTSSSKKPQEGRLVIEIPRRVVDEFSSRGTPLPSSRFPMEQTASPVTARFRSLRRLWSLGRRTAGSPCSPEVGDIEQGLGGGGEGRALPPKSPANS